MRKIQVRALTAVSSIVAFVLTVYLAFFAKTPVVSASCPYGECYYEGSCYSEGTGTNINSCDLGYAMCACNGAICYWVCC